MAPGWFTRDPRTRLLADLRARDVVATREGLLIDLAADRRLQAVAAAAGDPADDVHEALLALLDDPLDDVRTAAVRELDRRGSVPAARVCARDAIAWDPARFVGAREAAWRLLERTEADGVAELLTAALLAPGGGEDISPAAVDALAGLARGRPDRAAAVFAVLTAHLGDEHAAVAVRATQLAALLGDDHEDQLVAALDDDRQAPDAARALGHLGSLTAVEPLAELLRSGRPGPARAAAARALGAIGGHEAVGVLRSAVDDPDVGVRRAAVASLAPLAIAFADDVGEAAAYARLPLVPLDGGRPAAEPHGNGNGNGNGHAPPPEPESDDAELDDLEPDELADDLPAEDAAEPEDEPVAEAPGPASDAWSGPRTNGAPTVAPRPAPARLAAADPARNVRGRPRPRGPRPGGRPEAPES